MKGAFNLIYTKSSGDYWVEINPRIKDEQSTIVS